MIALCILRVKNYHFWCTTCRHIYTHIYTKIIIVTLLWRVCRKQLNSFLGITLLLWVKRESASRIIQSDLFKTRNIFPSTSIVFGRMRKSKMINQANKRTLLHAKHHVFV